MRGGEAIGMGDGMGAGIGVGIGATGAGGARGGAKGAATGVTTGVVSGAAIDGGGGPVGKADGPPDIIFENAIGSNPGGICIPAAAAAATISAAVGSTVPVMKLYPGGPEGVVGALAGTQGLAASLTA